MEALEVMFAFLFMVIFTSLFASTIAMEITYAYDSKILHSHQPIPIEISGDWVPLGIILWLSFTITGMVLYVAINVFSKRRKRTGGD